MNYQSPSEAIIMNLSAELENIGTLLDLMVDDLWLGNNPHCTGDKITERPGHCQSRNLFICQPNSIRADFFSIFISIWFQSAFTLNNSLSLCLNFSAVIN